MLSKYHASKVGVSTATTEALSISLQRFTSLGLNAEVPPPPSASLWPD